MRVELKGIHKYYGSVRANDGVDLTVEPGTIHGILGENGAGKSTLMKILAGFIQATEGEIKIDGTAYRFKPPSQVSRLGIGMLYQEPLDFPSMTVLENFMLGQTAGFRYPTARYTDKLNRYAEKFRFSLRPNVPVNRLTVGERQQLEILRLLSLGIEVLILDEPTTGISSAQKGVLFEALKKLAADGKSLILVSHKMEDVETLCDRVTVLRQGKVTGEMEKPFQTASLLKMMFGTPPASPTQSRVPAGETVMALRSVSAKGGRTGLKDCRIEIREGEIVGLAGLEGSGQGVFLRVAAGLKAPLQGKVELHGQNWTGRDYHFFREAGAVFLPTDRLGEGLISGLTISEHFILLDNEQPMFVDRQASRLTSSENIKAFNIKGRPELSVEKLSGGNQQRLLLSFLPPDPALLLLENPTRGLDMESVNWVWQYLQQFCSKKTGIVFSSSELDEILMVADRVLVFFNGRVVKDVATDQIDIESLGRAIAGKSDPLLDE
jgi:simple sugar transport system ATP-binding protein